MNYPCISCQNPVCLDEDRIPCDWEDHCFGGEQDKDCLFCNRLKACIQEHENIGINHADDDAADKELFNEFSAKHKKTERG